MISYVFERFELKYLLTPEQYRIMKAAADERLRPDEFGETTIQSLYFDTPDYRLVRASLEGPVYKEKLRVRCYGMNDDDRNVYIEMKRKSEGVVYKRRISCKEPEGLALFGGSFPDTQIGRELDYFRRIYEGIGPRILILSERAAFFDPESDLRVTFDTGIRYRTTDLNFHTSAAGTDIIPPGYALMELKAGASYPLWLCRLLSDNNICKRSFSKIGAAYVHKFYTEQNSRSYTNV